jgi:tryptophan synthase beta chain
LDYAAIGPEHALMRDNERAFYTSATDTEALNAFQTLCHTEGIIPALESSHALGWLLRNGSAIAKDSVVIANLSGRGDKDLSVILSRADGEGSPQ